jgi:signal transduction histidine kinase
MRERIRSVSGRLEIDSKPGTGTRVNVEVPL